MVLVNTRNDVAKIVTDKSMDTQEYTQGQLYHDKATRSMWSCPGVRCLRCVLCPAGLLGENIRAKVTVTQDSSLEATEDFGYEMG